jgi:hypothetical protein
MINVPQNCPGRDSVASLVQTRSHRCIIITCAHMKVAGTNRAVPTRKRCNWLRGSKCRASDGQNRHFLPFSFCPTHVLCFAHQDDRGDTIYMNAYLGTGGRILMYNIYAYSLALLGLCIFTMAPRGTSRRSASDFRRRK